MKGKDVGVRIFNRLIKMYKKTEFTQKIFITARTYRTVESTRPIEYSWVLRHLGKNVQKILDVGSTNSLFPIELASMGYDVYSIDMRSYKKFHGLIHPKMKFIRGDIRFAMFQGKLFDVVTAISTIEHIGTRDYRNPIIGESEDVKAIREIAGILKNDGKFIFTVPYRHEVVVSKRRRLAETFRQCNIAKSVVPQPSPLRIYNEDTIRNRLLDGVFSVEEEAYYCKQNSFWHLVPREQIKTLSGERLVCIVARRRKD